jgi:hypothetical protein
VFAHHFEGAELPDVDRRGAGGNGPGLLEQWLKDPKPWPMPWAWTRPSCSTDPRGADRLFQGAAQGADGRHDGGSRWIGTGGTSPVGHSGYHPGRHAGGGVSRNKSAVKVAMERRYKDYSLQGPLTQAMMGEALKRLRHLRPAGPKDQVNVDETIYQTMKNAGEIEIVFDRQPQGPAQGDPGHRQRRLVHGPLYPGGADPVRLLPGPVQGAQAPVFPQHHLRYLWEDPARYRKPLLLNDFVRLDPETRFILVGDASMAPYELMSQDGSIHVTVRSGRPSIECLKFLAETFKHSASG